VAATPARIASAQTGNPFCISLACAHTPCRVRLMCMAVSQRGHERGQGSRCSSSASAKRLALDGASFARAILSHHMSSFVFSIVSQSLSLFPAIEMHRDIHRAHAKQEPAAHMRERGEAFAVEKPYSGENHRPYDQHGDHILRQRMSLLWGQVEHRPILRFAAEITTPLHHPPPPHYDPISNARQ